MTKNYASYENNWESHVYIVNGKRFATDFSEVRIKGFWYPVKWREVSVPYTDMGHDRVATSKQAYVQTTLLFGVSWEAELNLVMKKLRVKRLEVR